MKIYKIIFFILFLILLIIFGNILFEELFGLIKGIKSTCFFVLSFVLFILIYKFKLRKILKNSDWVETFTHELIHLVFNLLFGNKVTNFSVSNLGFGKVEYYGKSNFIISLTPYFFPIYTFFFILLNSLTIPKMNFLLDIFIGITFAFHILTFIRQISINQSDITKNGILFSFLTILVFNTFFITITILNINHRGYNAFVEFFDLFINTISSYF